MKNTKILFLFLLWLVLGSVALAQAGKPDLPDAPQPQASASAQSNETSDATAGASDEGKVISQAGRYPRLPRRPVRSPRGYGYRPAAPMPGLSPMGALIGFGAGAALGASGSQDTSGKARVACGLLIGAIGAVIGGAIGAAPHFQYSWRVHRPSAHDDDDDSDLRSDARKPHPRPSVATTPAAPSQSAGVEATAQTSTEELSIP